MQNDVLTFLKETGPILASIFGAYVGLKVKVAKLEVKVDAAARDIDGLAKIIGTERSKNERKENE